MYDKNEILKQTPEGVSCPLSMLQHSKCGSIALLRTKRCRSVYLGLVVLRVGYFQHALLQLNNCHHIPPEKINPLFYFFAEPHSLYSMFQPTTKILSHHDNVLKSTSSTQTCFQPNCNIGHKCLQPGK